MILAKSGRIEFDVSYAWIMRSISASDAWGEASSGGEEAKN